jgi:preprotein translocase subunit YajC
VLISSAFAQTAPAAAAGGTTSLLMNMLPFVAIFAVMYFVMIRPQMRKQKEHRAMIDALAKGDEVVTAGGLLGRVAKLDENFVSLEVADNVEVRVQRTAIAGVMPKNTLK